METNVQIEKCKLSATRLKKLESCSWLYYATYHLKCPEIQTPAVNAGKLCHKIIEDVTLLPEFKSDYQEIVRTEKLTARVDEMVAAGLAEYNLPERDSDGGNYHSVIGRMALRGILAAYRLIEAAGYQPVGNEVEFELKINDFYIGGFIDRIAYSADLDKYIIIDYKTNKKKFVGKDIEINTQAMMYSLWARKQYNKLCVVKFVFLRWPGEDSVVEVSFNAEELDGFSVYLGSYADLMRNFTIKDAMSNFAYDIGFPSDGSFGGRLMCGKTGSFMEKRADGHYKWSCPVKHPFTYYLDANGKSYLEKPRDIETVEVQYKGCPKFYAQRDDQRSNQEKGFLF